MRVTNDRQSKKGWLWSERNWGSLDSWTITLRLRVSGQGKRLFGDGEQRGRRRGRGLKWRGRLVWAVGMSAAAAVADDTAAHSPLYFRTAGMALWFTTSSAYVPGPAHGFTDTL